MQVRSTFLEEKPHPKRFTRKKFHLKTEFSKIDTSADDFSWRIPGPSIESALFYSQPFVTSEVLGCPAAVEKALEAAGKSFKPFGRKQLHSEVKNQFLFRKVR